MSGWEFKPQFEDDELTLEWYLDKSNVVHIALGKAGLSWAAVLQGKTQSGRLTPVKASVKSLMPS